MPITARCRGQPNGSFAYTPVLRVVAGWGAWPTFVGGGSDAGF